MVLVLDDNSKIGGLVVLHQKVERAAERRRPLAEQRVPLAEHEPDVQQRDAAWVQRYGKSGDDFGRLVRTTRVAPHGIVGTEVEAVVELFAVKGAERGRADHREDQKRQ